MMYFAFTAQLGNTHTNDKAGFCVWNLVFGYCLYFLMHGLQTNFLHLVFICRAMCEVICVWYLDMVIRYTVFTHWCQDLNCTICIISWYAQITSHIYYTIRHCPWPRILHMYIQQIKFLHLVFFQTVHFIHIPTPWHTYIIFFVSFCIWYFQHILLDMCTYSWSTSNFCKPRNWSLNIFIAHIYTHKPTIYVGRLGIAHISSNITHSETK